MVQKKLDLREMAPEDTMITPAYGGRAMRQPVPKYEMPEGELAPDSVYDLIHDELMLDGNSRLNLATFVTTWMEPQAAKLMAETFDKNMIDKDEYPQTAEIELRCVNMLGDCGMRRRIRKVHRMLRQSDPAKPVCWAGCR